VRLPRRMFREPELREVSRDAPHNDEILRPMVGFLTKDWPRSESGSDRDHRGGQYLRASSRRYRTRRVGVIPANIGYPAVRVLCAGVGGTRPQSQ
jgi:hypothetical protein